MTPEEKQAAARDLGLDSLPDPRGDVPEGNKPVPRFFKPTFYKALTLIDPLETAAFERFIPDFCVIDLAMNGRQYYPGQSYLASVRLDKAPPSNARVARATGIVFGDGDEAMSRPNFYRWLGIIVAQHFIELNAVAMSAPLIFTTERPRRWRDKYMGVYPMLGAILKLDRYKKASMIDGELMASRDVGVIVPPSHFQQTHV